MTPDTASSSMAPDSPASGDDPDTQSLSPSVIDYPTYMNRTYHRYKENSYLYPNDEPECDRLDFQHNLIKRVHCGKLLFAPVSDPRMVLDIGTGTGIWPIELALSGQFPNARIVGTDLSPIQPKIVPTGVEFEVDDCSETDWRRPPGSIDYIHTRMMLGALNDFGAFIHNARRYLRPGTGYLECHELLTTMFSEDNSIPAKWPYHEWEEQLHQASMLTNPPKPIRIAHKIKAWMEQAGYVDVHEHVNKIPLGSWPKDKELKKIGKLWRENFLDGLSSWSNKLLNQGLGWSEPEIQVRLMSVREGVRNRAVHGYHKMYVVYGRRPTAAEEAKMRVRR